MPEPQVEEQIEEYLATLTGLSEAEIDKERRALIQLADMAEGGNEEAQDTLTQFRITVIPAGRDWMDWIRSAMPGGRETVGGGPSWARGEELVPEPTAALALPEPEPELGQGVTPGPFPGTFWYTDPATGKRLLVQRSEDQYGVESLRVLDEIAGEPTGVGPQWTGTTMKNLATMREQAAYRGEWELVEEIDRRMQDIAMGVGGGGAAITPYQQAQLDLSRQRLGLETQEAERAWLGTQIQAARTAQPLSYLSLLRGQVPGAGGTEIYQGLRRAVPTLAGAGGGAGIARATGGPTLAPAGAAAEGWEAPEMWPAMATVSAGRPLRPTGAPAGVLRPPGPQAQAAMTPFESRAYAEAAEVQGMPLMDWEDLLTRTRRAVGPGLSLAGYGGRIGR